MIRRTHLLAAIGAVAIVAASCAPPPTPPPVQTSGQTWTACTAAVTTVDDAQPKPTYPCLPHPPQRMDVLIPMATAGTPSTTEVERCTREPEAGGLGGFPEGPVLPTAVKLRCRTVKVA